MNDTIIQLPQCAHPVLYNARYDLYGEREREREKSSKLFK